MQNVRSLRVMGLAFFVAVVIAACGGGSTATPDPTADGGVLGDAAMFADGVGSMDGTGGCVPKPNDPKNCGSCGKVCPATQICSNTGTCECPLYQKFCGGVCMPTSVDPDNCGGCGKVCTGAELCSAGKCVPLAQGCIPGPTGGQPGLTPCNRACVDTENDSKNCGACGTVCPPGQGCVAKVCVPAITVGPAPAACVGGGPPVSVSPGPGGCAAGIAATTFRFALCSCGDITLASSLSTDAYDTTAGPYPPNPRQVGGGVGLNGVYSGPVSNPVDLWGALYGSGASITTRGPSTVHQEAHANGNVTAATDAFSILDDTYVGGTIAGTAGTITISKTLTVPAMTNIGANVTAPTKVFKPVSVGPPCDCAASQIIPVAAIISAHQTANDNALISLSPGALATPDAANASKRLDLPCGSYYLSSINQGGSVTIFAHGRTALFIDGDVVGQIVSFVLDATAEFDVFIKGTITSGGELILGSPNFPALSRTYIGGAVPLVLSGEAGRLAGNLYAPNAPISVTSHLVLYGALFGKSFSNTEAADIHYDRAVLGVGSECPAPPGADGGSTPCGTCKDCGNQACINGSCGLCTNSGQCCAPLTCGPDGTCRVIPR